MSTPIRYVLDESGIYASTVVMTDPHTGEWLDEPYAYSMQEGYRLIKPPKPPSNIIKPQWTGENWRESANANELEEAKLKRVREQALLNSSAKL